MPDARDGEDIDVMKPDDGKNVFHWEVYPSTVPK
jgi:hypothetical protein